MLCEGWGWFFGAVVDEGLVLVIEALVAGLDLAHAAGRVVLLTCCNL